MRIRPPGGVRVPRVRVRLPRNVGRVLNAFMATSQAVVRWATGVLLLASALVASYVLFHFVWKLAGKVIEWINEWLG